jgi:hypothetical protein
MHRGRTETKQIQPDAASHLNPGFPWSAFPGESHSRLSHRTQFNNQRPNCNFIKRLLACRLRPAPASAFFLHSPQYYPLLEDRRLGVITESKQRLRERAMLEAVETGGL